jgi:hypothetical protein
MAQRLTEPALLPHHVAPERLYLEARWPITSGTNATTLREHVLHVAEGAEAELGEERPCFIDGCPAVWQAHQMAALARQPAPCPGDVDGELMRGASEFTEVGVIHLQRADIVLEEADYVTSNTGIRSTMVNGTGRRAHFLMLGRVNGKRCHQQTLCQASADAMDPARRASAAADRNTHPRRYAAAPLRAVVSRPR